MATNYCHNKLITLLSKQGNQMDRLYARKARELAAILKRYKLKDSRNVWKGNKAAEREIEKVLEGLDSELKAYMLANISTGQDLSNICNDAMVEQYLTGVEMDSTEKAKMFFRNQEALAAFTQARIKGLDLSSRVWNVADQSKEQIEYFLKSGLADGTSAATIATDIKKFLKEPDKRFRRIRDESGKLILSNPAKNYHPGRGVYRSSYKNALRLARNEINIGYRNADHIRRQELDFIMGVKVNLSNAHPRYDICDELQGSYPKGFTFWGWHPNCLCFTTSILLPRGQFIEHLRTGNAIKGNQVTSIPARAQKHLNEIAPKIKASTNKPYFVTQNFKNTKDGLGLKSKVTK